jgi:hypothetical protein
MTQTQTQFHHPLLRIGSIAFIAGVIIAVVSTAIHPSRTSKCWGSHYKTLGVERWNTII